MLTRLSVHNYALIKELDLNLSDGLTIITGETGAGKSILLGALSLILGARTDSAVLLDKSEKCIVEGIFSAKGLEIKDFFAANDLDYEDVVIMRREINPAGKSRAFINDTPVTVNLMKELGEKLIDIHSQHQTLMLNDNSFQLAIIDSFAGTSLLTTEYRSLYNNFRRLQKEYNEMVEMADRNKADLDYYRFQLNQLEEAKLVKGEQTELEKEQELLMHAEEITQSLSNISGLLSGGERTVLTFASEAKSFLLKIKSYIPGGEELFDRLTSAYIELDDIASEVERMSQKIEIDPERLQKINNRLSQIYSLIQKHRLKDLDELLIKKDEIEKAVNSISTNEEMMEKVTLRLKNEEKSLIEISVKISEKRRAVLHQVESRVTDLLRNLGMPNAKFRISISGSKDFTPSGTDIVDFSFSANKQVEPENLVRIASGGELSRVMLSLKSLLSKNNRLSTVIFDEIDSGVSGEVADKVGQILASMGKYMQVVNITHLPQVASRGTEHYHVYKEERDDSTITRIKLLSEDERVVEIARLLSGSEITETAMKNARELLESAIN
jgi:DNA repair protein RecN (Recombination protein N)